MGCNQGMGLGKHTLTEPWKLFNDLQSFVPELMEGIPIVGFLYGAYDALVPEKAKQAKGAEETDETGAEGLRIDIFALLNHSWLSRVSGSNPSRPPPSPSASHWLCFQLSQVGNEERRCMGTPKS